MKKLIALFGFTLIILSPSCKKESLKKALPESTPSTLGEIDIEKLENSTGIQFKILKTEVIGYKPLHKFYWVRLKNKVNNQDIETLVNAIIQESIA